MCGICGFTGSLDDKKVIAKMMDRIIHRGPDSSGVHIDEHITLGFRRLSFIDLKDGSQPIYNEDKSIVLVFNGEIYNYRTLREQLIALGHTFATRSDSEVLVHLYEQYGSGLLSHLRGMFAFVIHETKTGVTFAARDFFGIKPLYYFIANGSFIFGSEIKCLLEHPSFKKELNEEALEQYLTFQYSVLPETFFKNVYKLMPGHYLTFKDGQAETTRYFKPEFKERSGLSLDDAVGEIDAAVLDSIEMHKISDVEVGSFLSSGVDSSYVAACFNGDKTFTVGFDYDSYNEISYAKALSEKVGIANINKTITTEEYWEHIPRVQYHMDEPLADPSAIALYFVSQLASKHVKGALSGEGADEFFGGYNIYREPMDMKIITWLPFPLRRLIGRSVAKIPFSFKGKNFLIRAGKTIEERFIGNANMFSLEERKRILKAPKTNRPATDITNPLYRAVKEYDDITKMQYLDIHLWLVGDILLKADKMSMAHSLEVRVPFLDKEVFRVASGLPLSHRVNKKATKYAFRLAANRHLPDAVATKKKLGFPVPIRIWLREEKYYNIIKNAFSSEGAKYFNYSELMKLLDDHKDGKRDNSRKIWTIYMFLVWYGEFFAA